MDREDIKEHLVNNNTWLRGLYMLLFALCYSIAEIIIFFIAVFQFLHNLVTGNTQARLLSLGKNLTEYVSQIFLFLTYNSEDKPFPFGPWPGNEEVSSPEEPTPAPKASKKKSSKKKATKKAVAETNEDESPLVDDDDEDAHEAHLGV